MIYLIGGAPRVGKSMLALELVKAKPMPYISLDFLYSIRQIKDIPEFDDASILDKGRLFYPTLKELLLEVDRRSEHCVLDGEVILPEFIAELSFHYQLKACFLGLSETNLQTIISYGGYFNWPKWKLEHERQSEVAGLAERTVARSKVIQSEAEKHKLLYYDLGTDYQRTFQAALHELL